MAKLEEDEKKFQELYKKDPERAEKVRKLMKDDPSNSWDNYLLITEENPVSRINNKTKAAKDFTEHLFDTENSNLYLDEGSALYFNKLPYEVIAKAGEDNGVVKPLPPNPTEEQKAQYRKEVGQLYKYLGKKATAYQIDKIWNTKDPNQNLYGDLQDFVLKSFFGPTSERMKEKVKRGESAPSSWTDFENMDAGDVATFSNDFGKNVLLGLTPGGAAKSGAGFLEALGLGASAGLMDAYNRDYNTAEELDALDYLSNAVYGAGSGVVAKNLAPALLKQAGDIVKKLGGGTKSNLFKHLGELIEDAGLAASGQKVNLDKYGKQADVAQQAIMSIMPLIDATAPSMIFSGVDIPLVPIKYGSPVGLSLEEAAAELKRTKPEAWKAADSYMLDFNVDNPFSPEDMKIYNEHKKKMYERFMGGEQ